MEPSAKNFRKRNAILTCVQETTVHPSADWVFNQLKAQYQDISLGTVYRNLALFKEQGKIVSIGNVAGVERFDGNIKPHVHFVCSCCASVQDLHQLQIPEELSDLAARCTGGIVEGCQLTFTGLCDACSKTQTKTG